MRHVFIILLGAFLLTACQDDQIMSNEAPPMGGGGQGFSGKMAMAESDQAPPPRAPVAPQGAPAQENATAPVNYLAYRYNYQYELPSASVGVTAKSHAKICMDAGPTMCQVLNSSQGNYSTENAYANLSLRAEPDWLVEFMEDINASVVDAKGKLTSENSSVEDVTRAFLDTDARLKSKITLKTRLEGLLETRNAELKDLLALERELARVQSEIESATSQLNVLKTRVRMSVVDISYQSKSVAVGNRTWRPVKQAFGEFFYVISESFAAVIYFIAAILPWLILIIPGFWFLRCMWRRHRARKAESIKSRG